MEDELLELERQFALAIAANDASGIDRILDPDWVIVDPDGKLIDKAAFLAVIASGDLTHEAMDSDDLPARIYGETAVVTARTSTRGA